MNPIQNTKTLIVLPPGGADDGDFAAVTPVDVSGYGHARFIVITGSLAAAIGSVAEDSALKVQECDTVDGTYVDRQGAALAAPLAATDDNKSFAIDINLQNGSHGRYMKIAQPHVGDGSGTDSNLAITAILSKPEIGPANATEQGLDELVVT